LVCFSFYKALVIIEPSQ